MYRTQILRSLVNKRLTAAAEEIFGVFERTIEEYEGEINRQRKLLDALKPDMRTDSLPPQLLVCEEEVRPEQQERSPSLLHGLEQTDIIEFTFNPGSVKCENNGEKTQSSQLSLNQDPEPSQMKDKQEELFQDVEEAGSSTLTLHSVKYENDGENTLSSQLSLTQDPELLQIKEELLQGLEEAESSKTTLHPVKCEDGQENTLPFQPLQTQREKNREAYLLPSTSTEQMKTEPDGEDCGVSEPASNLDPAGDLESTRDGQLLSSDCSGTETDDRDDAWRESGELQSGLKTLKSKKTQKSLSDNKFKSSMESSYELCKVCGKSFPNEMSFMLHIQVHSSDCGLCGKHLDPTESLNLHLEAHRICTVFGKGFINLPFICTECGEGFNQKGHLNEHMRIHMGKNPFSCTECGKGFNQKSRLQGHMRMHLSEKPFSCTECGKGFTQKGHQQAHMRIHTGERPFSCTVCGKGFTQKGHQQEHMRIHTGEKPFICSVCGKRFGHNRTLNLHMRIHSSEKPFSCTVCGKGFKWKGNLIEHMRIHTGEKPFSCAVCGKKFADGGALATHRRWHAGVNHFRCMVCGKGFNQKGHLQEHMRIHTGEKPVMPTIH